MSLTLWKILHLFADDSTLLWHLSAFWQTGSSLFPLFTPWQHHKLVKHLEYVFQSWEISFSLSLSLPLSLSPKGSSQKSSHPQYFLTNPLKEVQSLKLLGLTLSHDLSWVNHISKLASKARYWLGILLCVVAFEVWEEKHTLEMDLTRCHHVLEERNKFQSSFLRLDRCCFLALLRVDTHLLRVLWNDLRLPSVRFEVASFQEENATCFKATAKPQDSENHEEDG